MSNCNGQTCPEKEKGDAYQVYKVFRGTLGKEKQSYEGVYYRNCFHVSGGPIYLIAVEFYGPATAETAEYNAAVTVDTPLWKCKYSGWYFFFPCFRRPVHNYGKVEEKTGHVKKGDTFRVEFDQPIFLPEATWIEISFTIDSDEDLACMDSNSQLQNKYRFAKLKTEDGFREFMFMRGSLQLPKLEFCVKNPLKKNSTPV